MAGTGYNKMFPVSWTELHRDARALAWRLADLGPFKGLVAITRGGLVPAAIIARELGIPAVVGCGDATDKLKDGQTAVLVALDSFRRLADARSDVTAEVAGLADTGDDNGADTGAAFVADETEFNVLNTDMKLAAIEKAAKQLAALHPALSQEDIGRITAENARRLFKIA